MYIGALVVTHNFGRIGQAWTYWTSFVLKIPCSARNLAGQNTLIGVRTCLHSTTWGYQLSLGFSFRYWNAQLSAGHLRRWAYYTVEENRYRLESTLADLYQLVRESYAVAENVLLPMVGVGLSQRRLVGRGRYAAELGGQLWYLPASNQTILGLRSGVNRRLLSYRAEWQVGFSASYGLNQLLSEHQHLTIYPLIVGFTLRMQPNGKLAQNK